MRAHLKRGDIFIDGRADRFMTKGRYFIVNIAVKNEEGKLNFTWLDSKYTHTHGTLDKDDIFVGNIYDQPLLRLIFNE